jgi:hypothetical protein
VSTVCLTPACHCVCVSLFAIVGKTNADDMLRHILDRLLVYGEYNAIASASMQIHSKRGVNLADCNLAADTYQYDRYVDLIYKIGDLQNELVLPLFGGSSPVWLPDCLK